MLQLCHHRTPKSHSNSPEPAHFHRLRLHNTATDSFIIKKKINLKLNQKISSKIIVLILLSLFKKKKKNQLSAMFSFIQSYSTHSPQFKAVFRIHIHRIRIQIQPKIRIQIQQGLESGSGS